VPYQEPDSASDKPEFSSTVSSTLPMAAMFTRNRYIGWYAGRLLVANHAANTDRAAVVFTVQNWLGESQDTKKSTPGIFSVLMSVMALGVTYMPLFLPPRGAGSPSGTQPAAPVPSS
ncbi:hypothetical protein E4U53_006864, partial [Claviceps sorghi]